jgi:MSHA pilin protein MshD
MLVNKTTGFTLIELVVGIVVFAIALTLFTSLILPQSVRSVDPVFQVRAAELGQSLITEIASKSFDEKSDRTSGATICDAACIGNVNLGDDGESRANFNDVDDYNNLNQPGASIENALGVATDLYAGFNVRVSVMYDADMNGIADEDNSGNLIVTNLKLITVIVTTPNDENIIFSTFRSNY